MNIHINIGIKIIARQGWLGGVYYTLNLINALSTLSKDQRPHLYLVCDDQFADAVLLYEPIYNAVDGFIYYGQKESPFPQTVADRTSQCRTEIELFSKINICFPLNSIEYKWNKGIYWIPDFQHIHLPEFFTKKEIVARNKNFEEMSKHAHNLVFSSNHALSDFKGLYPESKAQTHILNFHSSYDEINFKLDPEHIRHKYNLPEKFLICCNQFWEHKDHPSLFKACGMMKDIGHPVNLVCTGAKSDYRNEHHFDNIIKLIKDLGIEKQVFLLGYIDRQDQLQLIRKSIAAVQPSLFEGWSTIIEDSRLLGKPILLSDFPVHLEQSPPHAIYFKRKNPDSLFETLIQTVPKLSEGPHPKQEAAARHASKQLIRKYALTFCDIISRSLQAPAEHPTATDDLPSKKNPCFNVHNNIKSNRINMLRNTITQTSQSNHRINNQLVNSVAEKDISIRSPFSKKPVLVTGSHRTGSTWIGNIIAESPDIAYLNEPFNVSFGICPPEIRFKHWFKYISQENAETFYKPPMATLKFIEHAITSCSKRPIMKDPIALLSSEWLANKFDMNVIVLIRHPAAFASSLKRLNWTFPFADLLNQPLLIHDHLSTFESEIREFVSAEHDIIDQAALLWRILNYMVIKYQKKYPEWIFMRHEDISLNPLKKFQTIFSKCNIDFTDQITNAINKYSNNANPKSTPEGVTHLLTLNSRKNILSWQKRLSADEIKRVRTLVEDISPAFYSENDWEPEKVNRHFPVFQSVDCQTDLKVSAIISTYNSEKFITGCLQDLLEQTLYKQGKLEIIIIDSGSEQKEGAIVKSFQKSYKNLVYLKTERETLYAAWNRGLKIAKGTYITNANTDDRHHPEALEIMAKELDNNQSVDLVYSNCKETNISDQIFFEASESKIYDYPPFFAPRSLLHYQFGPQPMWRKTLHDKIGPFNDTYVAVGDYEFNLRFALQCRAKLIPSVLGLFYKHDGSITNSFSNQATEKSKLLNTFRNDSVIFQLYRQEGFKVKSDLEKANVLNKMALLAINFKDPWRSYAISDHPFALACLECARLYQPENNVIKNNIKQLLLLKNKQVSYSTNRFNEIDLHPTTPTTHKKTMVIKPEPLQKNIGVFADQNNFVFMTNILSYLEKRHNVKVFDAKKKDHIIDALNWADVLWIEWTERLVKTISHLPKKIRVVCRLHSYEAYLPFIQEINWKNIDTILFMSQPMLDYTVSKVPDLQHQTNAIVLPEGIDINKFPYSKREHGNHIAFVGHLIQTKNISLLLQAYKLLLTENPDFHLHIFGEYTADAGVSAEIPKRYMSHMIKSMGLERNITFYGKVSHQELIQKMQKINYLISTSYRESYGFCIMEAMAMGIMPLIHNWPGAKTIYPEKFVFDYIGDLPNILQQPYNSREYRLFVETQHNLDNSLTKIENILTGNIVSNVVAGVKTFNDSNCSPPAKILSMPAGKPNPSKSKTAYLIYGEDITKSGIIRNQVIPLLEKLSRSHHYEITLISIIRMNFKYNYAELSTLNNELRQHGIRLLVLTDRTFTNTINKLEQYILSKNISLIHCRSYPASKYALKLKQTHNIPFIFDARGIMPEETKIIRDEKTGQRLPGNDDYKYQQHLQLESDLIAEAAGTVVLNDTFLKHYQSRYRESSSYSIIQNFVDIEKFAFSKSQRNAIRHKMNWRDKTVFVYSGSYSPWYDFELLIQWSKTILKHIPDAFFLILTYTDKTSNIAEDQTCKNLFAKNNISSENILFQNAPAHEVPNWLSASDIALIPHKERYRSILRVAQPIKFAEFLANGLPIIALDINCEINDILTAYKCGLLLKADHPLTSNLEDLQTLSCSHKNSDPAIYREKISAIAKRRYHQDDVTQKYAKLYDTILDSHTVKNTLNVGLL